MTGPPTVHGWDLNPEPLSLEESQFGVWIFDKVNMVYGYMKGQFGVWIFNEANMVYGYVIRPIWCMDM